MAASLQHQIRYQYNISGSRIVNASSLTYRVTSAWDRLQQQANGYVLYFEYI